ncbi:lamin B1 [Trichuris trichiura]|uniref:Lamin B1 n=1 Tax=Trichuris trichiura TaxID=36087 RepID=A0A077ZIY8_TRITR|nr:lamin B1 [Trichuris trichiura]
MSQRSVHRTTQISFVQTRGDSPPLEASDESAVAVSSGMTSPLTPTRMTRLQEKYQLQQLNDRLAQYIDRMRTLETENQRLGLCIRNSEEVVTRERNNMRGAYERELAETRRLCDELSHEKARLQIECGKQTSTACFNDCVFCSIGQLDQELKDHKKLQKHLEKEVQDLSDRLNGVDQQKRSSEQEYVRVKSELQDLRVQYQKLEKDLEDETLNRLDNENRVTSLREELAFSKQLYDKELEETRRKRQIEITEMNQELQDEYKQKLQEALANMREQLETQIRMSRKEVEDMYENKVNENLASDFADLEKKYNDLLERNSLLRDEMYGRLRSKDMEVKLLFISFSFCRLKLTPTSLTGGELVSAKGTRKRRIFQERESEVFATYLALLFLANADFSVITLCNFQTHADFKGEVHILDHDLDGMFVKLVNNSGQDVPIGGWTLKRKAGGAEVSYKFHAKLVLKSDKTVTVWSCNSGVTPNPPGDLVMRNQQWPVGPRIRTTLFNASEEEVAWRESEKASRSERTSYRSSDPLDYGVEDGEQRCSLM